MTGPRNLEEAKKYRYGVWSLRHYVPDICAEEIRDGIDCDSRQCTRKPGHGPDKIFCKQHARIRESKGGDAS